MGRDNDADSVFYSLRRREWHRFWSLKQPWNMLRGVVDTLYWLLALYGVRPIPLFLIAVAWLAVGWNVFRYPGAVVPKQSSQLQAAQQPAAAVPITLDGWDAAGMSLNLFAPIELWPSEWKPSREPVPIFHGVPDVESLVAPVPVQVYALFHKAFGWLTVPLAVAALTGLLQRRQRR